MKLARISVSQIRQRVAEYEGRYGVASDALWSSFTDTEIHANPDLVTWSVYLAVLQEVDAFA